MPSSACKRITLTCAAVAALGLAAGTGCIRFGTPHGSERTDNGSGSTTMPSSTTDGTRASDSLRDYPLDTLPATTVRIGEHAFRVWLAQEFDPQRSGIVSEGLMHVPPEEIEDDQGMLFVFSDEQVRGFWMLNTVTPLDIAFARMDGTIVKIWQMPAFTLRTFSSIEPAMFALEVKQGTFERLGIHEGDTLVVPPEALRPAE